MKQSFTTILLAVSFLISSSVVAAEDPSDVVKRPTADQVLSFAEALLRTPIADRKVAAEALQKKMDGWETYQPRSYEIQGSAQTFSNRNLVK